MDGATYTHGGGGNGGGGDGNGGGAAPPAAQRSQQQEQQQQPGAAEGDDMQSMWQYLDSTLSTPNGVPPSQPNQPQQQPQQPQQQQRQQQQQLPQQQLLGQRVPVGLMPAAMAEGDAAPLTEDDNGMYNELGDVFNMFFNLDTDDANGGGNAPGPHHAAAMAAAHAAAIAAANGQALDGTTRVPLSRHASASSSFGDGISPGLGTGYPSMSPATLNWLQSLSKSPSSESLSGLISPATMSFSGSAGGLSVTDGGSGSAQGGLPRSPSCELIDWKAYNDACGIAEKTQKEPAKWREIPQHGPHAAAGSLPPPPSYPPQQQLQPQQQPGVAGKPLSSTAGSGVVDVAAAPRPRSLFARPFQTIKNSVVSLVGALSAGEASGSADVAAAPSAPRYQTKPAHVNNQSGAVYQQQQQQQPLHQYQQQQHQYQYQYQQQSQPGIVLPAEVQRQYELAAQRMADEKNKRKAIISPEYVQYSSTSSSSNPSTSGISGMAVMADAVKYETDIGQYATQVQDTAGRRPSKKSLHQASDGPIDIASSSSSHSHSLASVKEEIHDHTNTNSTNTNSTNTNSTSTNSASTNSTSTTNSGGPVRCKCTGKCRNARCACVKAGFVCGELCKCVGCANPFAPMQKIGIDLQKMIEDVCLMQFLSKVKDMEELLESSVNYECCGHGQSHSVQVKLTVEHGFACPQCQARFTYSWCSNRLCHDQKKPRKHCSKCRRCGDHRNEHCDACNHCYFAGVANSFSCSCRAAGNSHSSGSGKSRSIVPNHHDDSTTNSPTNSQYQHHNQHNHQQQMRRGDENANPQTTTTTSSSLLASSSSSSAGHATLAAGLSSSEAEKDDACPVQ